MNERVKTVLIASILLLMTAGGAWWWNTYLEYRWEAQDKITDAVRENRMHAATLLLRQRGHVVTVAGSLGEMQLGALPDGTLILADGSGVVPRDRADQLLAWVRRGNTLIAQPRMISDHEKAILTEAEADKERAIAAAEDEEDDQEDDAAEPDAQQPEETEEAEEAEEAEKAEALPDLVEVDPIAARLGVRLYYPRRADCSDSNAAQPAPGAGEKRPRAKCVKPPLRRLMVPGTGHWLELDEFNAILVDVAGAPKAPLWSDEHGTTVRVYDEGKGRIVMLTSNFFVNDKLRTRDHAELLVALSALSGAGRHVTIVKFLDVLPWYQALWERYFMLIIGIGATLSLLLWAGVRRFGPLLPAPANERRSLMEHIDASGAWLWNTDGGRQLLLETARNETMALIKRRAPALLRLPAQQLHGALARLSALPEAHISEALEQDASSLPQQFTRQIRTLQTLRNHHER